MESKRHARKHSKSLNQDVLYKGIHAGGRDTPVPGKLGRDAKTIQSIASIIDGKSKLLLLESPDTVEVYKLDRPVVDPGGRGGSGHVYLPAISSLRGALSQSCPYLYKHNGSFSSIGSQRTADYGKKQSSLQALKEAKRSNVSVTMTYLGQGGQGAAATPDHLKVLQQICGGENVCVFKGLVKTGEQFQFTSRRHRGFPFSASLYVNSLMAARISACCEYRYGPGFQQGRKSCFRLAWLAGGMPCYRCTSLRNKYSSCQQLNNGTTENLHLPQNRNPGTTENLRLPQNRNPGTTENLRLPQNRNPGTTENLRLPQDQNPGNPGTGAVESRPSSPLFIPVQPEEAVRMRRVRRVRKAQPTGGDSRSTESDDPAGTAPPENRKSKRRKGQSGHREDHKDPEGSQRITEGSPRVTEGSPRVRVMRESGSQTTCAQQQPTQQKKARKVKTPQKDHQEFNSTAKLTDSSQDEEALNKQNEKKKKHLGPDGKRDGERLRDFYEECVEMSAGLDLRLNKQSWFKASMLERRRLQKRLLLGPVGGSDLEPSEESDSALHPDTPPGDQTTAQTGDQATGQTGAQTTAITCNIMHKHVPVRKPDLQTKLDAMMMVLNTSDEVEQLVLRNTGLTDDLLLSLASGLKGSPSEVTLLNLNLNLIGPYGAPILLDLLWAKPQVKGLLLFGNQLGDSGVLALLSGLAELQGQEMVVQPRAADPSHHSAGPHSATTSLPTTGGSLYHFVLLELDIGGNGLSSEGLKVLASYMRHYSQLQYLGLAQTGGLDLEAWAELFDSLKENTTLTQIILDESALGDRGVRLFAEMLLVNCTLRKVDLDRNGISEVGGGDLLSALLYRAQRPLWHLSLEGNAISAELTMRIQQEVRYN